MFKNAVKLFTLDRLDIKVDPSWLVIAALVTWSLATAYFPTEVPGLAAATYLAMALVAMLGLFASLLLHELAHSIVARRLGVPIRGITLFLFGGVAELDAEPTSPWDEFRIALAGPAMSICLAIGFWTLTLIARIVAAPWTVTEVVSYLALINLVLAVFNLVPAFPLDGGRVLRAWLWHRTGNVETATRISAGSGAFFAYALMALGVFALFQGAVVAGIWYMMIGAFVLIAARASMASRAAQSSLDGMTVSALMTGSPVTVSPETTLAAFVNQIMLRYGISFVPVTEGGVLLGHMDRSILSEIDREHWASTQVGDVFFGFDRDVMIAPDMPVRELMDKVARTGQRKFMVVSDHALVGVITLSDIARHLRTALATDSDVRV